MSATQIKGSQVRALAGDISGTGNAVSVDKLKGTPISATVPTTGQSLVFNGTSWAPSSGSGGAATALATTGADVVVSGATPPLTGQILTATSPTTAAWQSPGANPYAGTGSFVLTNTYHYDDGTFNASPERSTGLAYDGTNFWMFTETNAILKVSGDGTQMSRYPIPSGQPSDMIFAFSYIWVVSDSFSLHKIDPSTGAIVATYVSGIQIKRLTANASYIFASGNSNGGVIYRFDPVTGLFNNQFVMPQGSVVPDSIVTDGNTTLWIIDQASALVQRVNRDPSYATLQVFNTTWIAVDSGVGGNAITIVYAFHGSGPVSVGVVGNDITITIVNGFGGDTEGAITSAVNNDPVASLLVKGASGSYSDRHNYNTAPYNTPQNLANGTDHQLGTIDVSASGLPVAGISAAGFLWVTMNNGDLLKIDQAADTVLATFPSGASALGGIVNDGRFIYVTETAPDNKFHTFDYANASGEYFVDIIPAGNVPDDIVWDNGDNLWSMGSSDPIIRRLNKKDGSLLGQTDITGHGFPRRGTYVNAFLYVTTSIGHLLKIDPTTDVLTSYFRTGTSEQPYGPDSLNGGADAVFASEQPGLTKFTAVASGPAGNNITIQFTPGGVAGSEVVSVLSTAIEVQIEDNVSTSQQIADAVNAFPAASALVVASVIGGGSAESVMLGPLNLVGGADATTATFTDPYGVTWTAVTPGAAGNSITIELASGGTAGSESVGVVGTAITITIESGVSKAFEIVAASNGYPSAAALATASTASVTALVFSGVTISNGSVFLVADPSTKTIWYFNHNTELFADIPLDISAINTPDDIMWDQATTFWSLDFTSTTIKRIDAFSGTPLGDVLLAADGGLPRRLGNILAQGYLWVIMDDGNLLRCDPYGTGNILATYSQGGVSLSGIYTWGSETIYLSATGADNVIARFVFDNGTIYHHVVHTQDLNHPADRIKEAAIWFWTLDIGDAHIRKVKMDGGDTLESIDISSEGSPKDLVAIGTILYITLTNGKVARLNTGYQQATASLVLADLTFVSTSPGSGPNGYNVQYTGGGTGGTATVTVYDGATIVVDIESGVTTAQTVADAIIASTGNGPWITTITGSASNPQVTTAQTFFTGGGDVTPFLLSSLDSGKSALAGISEVAWGGPQGPAVGFTSPSNGYVRLIANGANDGVGDGFFFNGTPIIGGFPDRMAADATDLWVCDRSGQTDAPFRMLISTMTILGYITGAFGPNTTPMGVALLGGYTYMGDGNYPIVYKINPATNSVIKKINVGDSSGGNNWAQVRGIISDATSLWIASSVGNSFSTGIAMERITSDRVVAGIHSIDNDLTGDYDPMVKVGDALFVRMNYNMHRFNTNLG